MSRSSRRTKTPARSRDTRSSSLGLYAFYRLPHGTYTIRVSLSPLSFSRTGIEVRPRQKPPSTSRSASAAKNIITVRGTSALPRRLSDGSLGAAFSREAIDGMLKSNGENLQSILTAIPGIVFTESVGTLAQFTTMGQRRLSNGLTIDGVSGDLASTCSRSESVRPEAVRCRRFRHREVLRPSFRSARSTKFRSARPTRPLNTHAHLERRPSSSREPAATASKPRIRQYPPRLSCRKRLVRQCRQPPTGREEAIGTSAYLWEGQYCRNASSISERGNVSTSIAPSTQR